MIMKNGLSAGLLALALAGIAAEAAHAQMAGMGKMPGMPPMGNGAPMQGMGQMPGMGLGPILGKASDRALDKLAKPGAFAADDAIRIGLPGPAKGLGGLLSMAGASGAGGDIAAGLNTAAGQAASAAKPIFRAAIDKMTVKDAAGLGGKTGATDYLRKSAGGAIKDELRPLIHSALEKTGVMAQASQLASLGISPDVLTDYVAQKTAEGIFTYMGREEEHIRANPMELMGH